ncbi:MAG: UDP-glucose/GDP-mannose dehydrogenase family protein [Actinomycetota bacterium]|nr:UDP-glucose/GDP-mannose dehydrogenase family protein [Actinomycetota bacterium]
MSPRHARSRAATATGTEAGELPARSARRSAKVGVVGAGYVGLATSVSLAYLGHEVCCGDIDRAKVTKLARGEPTIVEEGIEEKLREGLASGRLRFVEGAARAAAGAAFVFLCVPTPRRDDGSADTAALEAAASEIGPHLEHGAVVVNKSTVPVGSTLLVERMIGRADVSVVSNPEFLREGSAVYDCLHPDRVVVGADDPGSAARVGSLFAGTGAPLIVTDAATAETIKYASNAFLATKLSFVNSVASLCEAVGADVRDVLLGMAYDRRIGFEYLRPGPGWGGSCLPKDTRALVYLARQAGYDFELLHAAIEANDRQLHQVVEKIRVAAGGELSERVVAVWGLTFKAGTDDRRESPALEVSRRLLAAGASLKVYDPTVKEQIPGLDGSVEICRDAYGACGGAHVLAVLTEWEELRWLDFAKVKDLLASPCVVDARNLLDPAALRRMGFAYTGIGRP